MEGNGFERNLSKFCPTTKVLQSDVYDLAIVRLAKTKAREELEKIVKKPVKMPATEWHFKRMTRFPAVDQLMSFVGYGHGFENGQVTPANVLRGKTYIQSITLIPDSRLYWNSHIPDWEFQSRAETAHTMFCTVWYSDIPDFLYTGL